MPAASFPATPAPGAPRFGTLEEWLSWQQTLHFTSIELGLDRCRTVAERMGLLEPGFAVISIAGTNGKGSAAAMLDLILRRAGHRVGRYTSPHLIRYNERIWVDGAETGDARLCEAFHRVDQARGDISLTYFEFGTLAALDIFRGEGLDAAVMEVGLGGRLDAVNILDADVALLTTVDLDHERWLGADREHIGREKAGIFRPGRPAVCNDPSPPASVPAEAARIGCRYLQLGRDYTFTEGADSWEWRSQRQVLSGLPKPDLHHSCQVQNAAGVLMAIEALSPRLGVSAQAIREALRGFHIPGRFQVVSGPVPHVLDVAHNAQAARVLVLNLSRLPCTGRSHFVVGMLRDKDHAAVLNALAPAADVWYFASLEGERGSEAARLAEALPPGSAPLAGTFDGVEAALAAAAAAAVPGDRIVVTGSFLTVGAAMHHLKVKG
jgi:dihydrofolate synthase/folylpolyglutamate synthase